jgi:tripartite-type tricarboxylate transporter receptor subunit TctC
MIGRWVVMGCAAVMLCGSLPAIAAELYEGKTVRFVVGFPAGGGFDIYARTMARHIGRHLPGNPTVIVENMPGASSLVAANTLYGRTRPDGLTVGFFHGNLITQHLLGGEGIAFDPAKFEWVGSPTVSTGVCAFRKASGITSIEEWAKAKEPVKLGGIAPGDTTYDIAKILAAALHLPLRLVDGHKGVPDIRLAAERGDVAGLCVVWETLKVVWSNALASGEVVPIVQVGPRRHPDLPNLPLASDLATTDVDRTLIRVGILNPAKIIRLLALPPGTSRDRVEALRRAFVETMKDPEFRAEAQRAKLDVDPLSGEEVQEVVAEFGQIPPDVRARLKDVLFRK